MPGAQRAAGLTLRSVPLGRSLTGAGRVWAGPPGCPFEPGARCPELVHPGPLLAAGPAVSGAQLAPRSVRGRGCLWGFLQQPPTVPMAFHEGRSFYAHRSPPLLAFFWYLS